MFKKSLLLLSAFSITTPSFAQEEKLGPKIQNFCNESQTQCYTTGGASITAAYQLLSAGGNSVDLLGANGEIVDALEEVSKNSKKLLYTPNIPQVIDESRIRNISREVGVNDVVEVSYHLNEGQNKYLHISRLDSDLHFANADLEQATKDMKIESLTNKDITKAEKALKRVQEIEKEIKSLKIRRAAVMSGRDKTLLELKTQLNGPAELETFLAKHDIAGGKVASIVKTPKATMARWRTALAKKPIIARKMNKNLVFTALAIAVASEEATAGLIAKGINKASNSKLEMKSYSNGSK